MKWIFCAAAGFIALSPCSVSAKALMRPQVAIGMIAEAHAWGDLCRNWSLDNDAVDAFLLSQELRLDDQYREIYPPAREKAEAAVAKTASARAACDHALDLYGPQGTKIPGLLKPRQF